ncbi:MAG: hypothetical protein C4525_15955 [Desulfarculus sp.]|jgi:hypothetical protein|nr:MAG: hypothetical protein C4525_15955 [Desulfarculus sp.]
MKARGLITALFLAGLLLAAGCATEWCNLYGPSTDAELGKARQICQKQIEKRNQYLLEQGQEANPAVTGWDMPTCLKVWGWYRCER